MLMSVIAKIISKLTTNSIQFHSKALILNLNNCYGKNYGLFDAWFSRKYVDF